MSVLNFTLAPELQDLRSRAAKVAAEGVEKFGRFTDSWMNGYSSEFSQMMASEGWIGMSWPKKHGGHERSSIERVIVGEEMISAGAPIAGMWFADRQMGPSLITHGTSEQQEKYLVPHSKVAPEPLIIPLAYSSTLAVTSCTGVGICFVIALADSRSSRRGFEDCNLAKVEDKAPTGS